MALLTILRELKTLEESVTISDPISLTAKAFLITPKQSVTLGQTQAVFENYPTPQGDEEQMGTFLEQHELITVRFTAYDANFDRACEIAVSFYDAFKLALAQQRRAGDRLNGSYDHLTLQEFQSSPFSSYDGRPGFELVLDFQTFRTVVYA